MKKYSKVVSIFLCVIILCSVLVPVALATNDFAAKPVVSSCDEQPYVTYEASPRGMPCNCGGVLFGPFFRQCYCQRWREWLCSSCGARVVIGGW